MGVRRRLCGHVVGPMSTPRVAWHPTSLFLFSTSDNQCVFVWNVRSEAVIGRVARHANKVRDLSCWHDDAASAVMEDDDDSSHSALLCSASFDKTMQVWDVSWRE